MILLRLEGLEGKYCDIDGGQEKYRYGESSAGWFPIESMNFGFQTVTEATIELVSQVARGLSFAGAAATSHFHKVNLTGAGRIAVDRELTQLDRGHVHALADRALLKLTHTDVDVLGTTFFTAFLHFALNAETEAFCDEPGTVVVTLGPDRTVAADAQNLNKDHNYIPFTEILQSTLESLRNSVTQRLRDNYISIT